MPTPRSDTEIVNTSPSTSAATRMRLTVGEYLTALSSRLCRAVASASRSAMIVGSVGGAVLGALWMQSLENGMVLLDVTSALRQVIIGLVLLAAVAGDARAHGSEM